MEAEFKHYLENRYKKQIEWYDSKSLQNQRLYKGFQTTVILLSFLTPIIIALSYDDSKIISIIVSSIVAILSTIIATFKFYENWVNYRTTCESLRKEEYYYNFEIGPYKGEKKEELFVQRIEELISKEHSLWGDLQKKK